MRDFHQFYCESQKAVNSLIWFWHVDCVATKHMRDKTAKRKIEKQTKSVYHLSGISRGMFWTKGTALFLSKEMNRIEPYQLILSFEISAGRRLHNNKDGGRTYCAGRFSRRRLSRNWPFFSALIKARISNIKHAKQIWKRSERLSFSPVLLRRCSVQEYR